MADYQRSTTAATLASLPEPVRSAIRERAAATQLTLADDAPAYLTHSRRTARRGLLGRLGDDDKDAEHLTAFVIGARDLLVATHGEQRGTAVLSARLEDVDVGSSLDDMAAAQGDTGVTVTGFPVSAADGGSGRGSYFVGLGAPAGDAARAALEQAVMAAKA
jgi:hypothetical protein